MNYGKKSTRKQQKELVSKGTMIRKKFYVIFCKALLICFFAVIIVGGCSAFGVISGIIASAPTIEDIDATPTGFLSTVLDNTGKETATLVASGSNRKYVTIDEIPLDLQHALLRSRMNVSTTITVLIYRVSSVPVSKVLPADIFPRVPVRSHSSF